MKAMSKYNMEITVLELWLYRSTFENSKYVKKQETIDNPKNM
jgi:hypothetical protein